MKKRLLSLIFLSSLLPTNALAGLFDDDEARRQIAALENSSNQRLQQLEAANRKILDLVNQMERMQNDIAQLKGRVDELNHLVELEQKQQKDLYIDLDNRLKMIEETKNQTQNQAEGKILSAIANNVRAGKYKAAMFSAQRFIATNPDSKLLGGAYYWLGLSQAGMKQWSIAETNLQKMIHEFPEEEYVPDAMLALASVQAYQGKDVISDRTLRLLIERYKNSPAALQAKKALASE